MFTCIVATEVATVLANKSVLKCHSNYCTDLTACCLSSQPLFLATVGTVWSLLGSARQDKVALHLFEKHLPSGEYIYVFSNCRRYWNEKKKLGSACEVFLLLSADLPPSRAKNWQVMCPPLYVVLGEAVNNMVAIVFFFFFATLQNIIFRCTLSISCWHCRFFYFHSRWPQEMKNPSIWKAFKTHFLFTGSVI